MLHFQLIKGYEIDKTQWDNCVHQSQCGFIYGQSFYLNAICPQWAGLIGHNYDWVLPIISNKKFGFSYLYQPPFAQQFGVYAKPGVEIPFQEIISWLKAKYKFWEINWNAATVALLKDEPLTQNPAANFILDLSNDYKSIAQNYHNDLVKNLKKSEQFSLQYFPTNGFSISVDLYKQHYGNRTPNVTPKDYNNFKKLCHFAQQNNMLYCRNAVNKQGEILSTAILLFDGSRLYNMMNTTTESGRKMSSNHFLIDSILREFSKSDLVFDFEGSDLPGVRSFYKNFGAANEPYFQLKYHNLPWPVKLFKQ